MRLKKVAISLLLVITFVLTGCGQGEFQDYKAQYIEEQGITDIEEIATYKDESYIENVIFKGKVDGQENLYYYEGLPGSQNEGIYANGAYTGTVLHPEEGMTYDIHKGEDYGYDKSYFIGIAYRKMTDVYYKGESIDFQTVDVTLNQNDISLTIWTMPFKNETDINISDFEYSE